MLILGLIGYTLGDLRRKKEPLEDLASRLEHLAKENDKIRFRHLRRTNLNAFSQDRVFAALAKEIKEMEQANGLPPQQEPRFAFFGKKIKLLEERVAQLEQLLA